MTRIKAMVVLGALLVVALFAVQARSQEPAKPDPLALTETEKKDLTIANLTLANMQQEAQIIQGRLRELQEQFKEQFTARAALVAKIQAAKGPDVVCDAEKLTCAKKASKKE